MPRILILLLLSTPLLAQSADVRVTLTPLPDRVEIGATVRWTATIENTGPDRAEIVEFISEGFGYRCVDEVTSLAPGERRTRDCSTTVPRAYFGSVVVVGLVLPSERDPDPSNNSAIEPIDINTPPDLIAFPETFPAVDPGLPFPVGIRYQNFARTAATGVTVTLTTTGITGFHDLPPNCTADGTTLVCNLGTVGYLPGENGGRFTIQAVAPDQSDVPLTITATIAAREEDFEPENNVRSTALRTYLTHFVTSASDSGPGSLRDAILANNIACTNVSTWCKVAFRIDAPGVTQVIRPATPLPAITGANTAVDGTTQTRYFGDRNLQGPEVELSGEALRGDADGLTVNACEVRIAGLVIHSFPRHGLFLHKPCPQNLYPRVIEANYIGTDATGTRARPNLRGIYVDGTPAHIQGNVISGNTRSGIWIQSGENARIYRNIIGLTPSLQPLGNGASGVYLPLGARGADVFDNYIGFNAHAGVSIERGCFACVASHNSYQANGGLAVDIGLDGPSPENVATITNAFYDAAHNETVIEGTVAREDATELRVHLFASDVADDESGYGEGQYVLGMVRANGAGNWRYVHRGRTPGRFLAALIERYTIVGLVTNGYGGGAVSRTAELSRIVEVQFPPQ